MGMLNPAETSAAKDVAGSLGNATDYLLFTLVTRVTTIKTTLGITEQGLDKFKQSVEIVY